MTTSQDPSTTISDSVRAIYGPSIELNEGKGLDPEDPHWLGEGISVYLDQGMVVLAEEREGESLRRIHLHDDEVKNLVRWLKSVERAKARIEE